MKLFSLDPIGIGTPEAESLPSYLHRLSRIHGVSIGQLLEGIERFSGRSQAPYRNSPLLAAFVRPNGTTQALVEDLEKVTNQKDLAALTLLPIMSCVARDMKCYSKDMRWCGTCLAEQSAASGESYYKLIWQFADLESCHLHGQTIEKTCAWCGSHQNTLKARRDAAWCQKCGRQLADNQSRVSDNSTSWKNDAFDLCHLVADLKTYLGETLESTAPVRFIDSVFDYYWFSQKEMELYAKVDQHEMLNILHENAPITLRTLRKFAYQLGLPIDSLLRGPDAPYEPSLDLRDTYKPAQLRRERRRRHDHVSVLKRIKSVMEEERPGLSLEQLAKESEVSVGYIADRLPHIKRKVVEDRTQFLVQEKSRKNQEALAAAFAYLARDQRLFIMSRKKALKVLINETGLPKNVLRNAIKVAFEQHEAFSQRGAVT